MNQNTPSPNLTMTPLSPHDMAFLAELRREGISEPLARDAEATLRRRTENEVRHRRLFRESLGYGRAIGLSEDDALEFAGSRATNHARLATAEARLRHTLKGIERTRRKHRDERALLFERAAKTAHDPSWRVPQSDKNYVDALGYREQRGEVNGSPLVRAQSKTDLTRGKLPAWSKTSFPLKVLALSIQSFDEGASCFSLNLHPRIETAARRSGRGGASYLQDRIRKALARAFPSLKADFWFVVESDDGRLHCHGAIITAHLPPSEITGIELALKSAGGGWADKHGAEHALMLKPMTGPRNWASYVLKGINDDQCCDRGRIYAVTVPLRRRAEGRWPSIRATLVGVAAAST